MLIICTIDPDIVRHAQQPNSGADRWSRLLILDPSSTQQQATASLAAALRSLGSQEPLCLSAHGNDFEIGGSGHDGDNWGWSRETIADLLRQNAPVNYSGPVLIRACAEHVSNFSAGLAVQLQMSGALNGIWIYGFNRPLPVDATYPRPELMGQSVELQGTQVVVPMRQPV